MVFVRRTWGGRWTSLMFVVHLPPYTADVRKRTFNTYLLRYLRIVPMIKNDWKPKSIYSWQCTLLQGRIVLFHRHLLHFYLACTTLMCFFGEKLVRSRRKGQRTMHPSEIKNVPWSAKMTIRKWSSVATPIQGYQNNPNDTLYRMRWLSGTETR